MHTGSIFWTLLLCWCISCCDAQAYFGADQVFDAFTFEGEMDSLAVQNLEVTLVANLNGISRWQGFRWYGGSIGWAWTKYFLRIQIIPLQKTARIAVFHTFSKNGFDGSGWSSNFLEFNNMPVNWYLPGGDYYWKLQVTSTGYQLHFNDVQMSDPIPTFSSAVTGVECCEYPLNQDVEAQQFRNSEWGGGTDASFERSVAVLFTRDYPCINPCDVSRVRWLFNCDPLDQHGLTWSPYPLNMACLDQNHNHFLYAAAMPPTCDLLDFVVNPRPLPSYWQDAGNNRAYVGDWCALVGRQCNYNATTGIYYDAFCEDPSEEWLEQQSSRRSERMRHTRTLKERSKIRRTSTKSRMHSRRSGQGGKPSGTITDRRKARNEILKFNFEYLHPVCWELEELMYLNQHSEHFPALFYWCYGALWCWSENKACSRDGAKGDLLLRNTFDARVNACLAQRGKIWSDLQIKEVLLNNFSNSSFDLNVSNNTIYAVAPIPASELEDNEPSFLTRLPLYQSLFGAPNCSTEDRQYQACYFAEGVPDFMFYRYKNMEYLRDWIDDVNYNVWLSQRRREYGIPKSKFDHKRYCNIFGHMCDPNALCDSRRKWPGYRCKCNEAAGYYGDGYFCTKAQTFAYARFKVVTTVAINSTLDKIAARFENITSVPREALNIASYVDVDALAATLGGSEVFLTMKYPTIDDQLEFAGWTELDNGTTPTKAWALKKELAKRKRYDSDPDQDPDLFNTERWVYGDVKVFQNPEDPDDFKVQHPAPTLAAFQQFTQFSIDIEDDDNIADIEVEVGDNESLGGGGPSARAIKALQNMNKMDGVSVLPSSEKSDAEIIHQFLFDDTENAHSPASEVVDNYTAAPMLIASGSVAGVVLLAVVGWMMHKRSGPAEQEATVMAVHELRELERPTRDVESDHGDETPQHKPPSSVKDRWRSNKGGSEDSFTLAQDRSGIWNADAGARSKPTRPEDSFKKAQDGSGIWNR